MSCVSRLGVGDGGCISPTDGQVGPAPIGSDILLFSDDGISITKLLSGCSSLTVDREEIRECETELVEEEKV